MTADRILLSAAMIVRDEERHLEECLRSIENLVDEIVIVDTGSVDRTKTIARGFGCRLVEYGWHDDFAAARNFGLDHCAGRWILYIDADERVRPFDRVEVRSALEQSDAAGHSVLLHARSGFTAYRELRIFRNDSEIRFEGLMHETIWPGIARFQCQHGGEIGVSGLVIDHVGYDGPQDHKHERNLPLLEKALAENPDHVYCWYHLGIVHFGLGEEESARNAWEKGLEAARRKRDLWPADALVFVELIQFLLARDEDADELLDEARLLFPEDRQLEFLLGQSLLQKKDYAQALDTFEGILRRMQGTETSVDIGVDRRQYTSVTYATVATCHFQLGDYEESGRWFARAEEADPENQEYRVKRQLCAHLRKVSG